MMPDLQTRVTGAPPVGISAWLAAGSKIKSLTSQAACGML